MRYADDTVILADHRENLQIPINKITYHRQQHDLNINMKMAKLRIINKNDITEGRLHLNESLMERLLLLICQFFYQTR